VKSHRTGAGLGNLSGGTGKWVKFTRNSHGVQWL